MLINVKAVHGQPMVQRSVECTLNYNRKLLSKCATSTEYVPFFCSSSCFQIVLDTHSTLSYRWCKNWKNIYKETIRD